MYVDAHLHIADYSDCCIEAGIREHKEPDTACCYSAHDHAEYERHRLFQQSCMHTGIDLSEFQAGGDSQAQRQSGICASDRCSTGNCVKAWNQTPPILLSFGIHPQNPVTDEADFLYYLLETKQIQAIGECGFDLFNDAYKQTLPAQQTVWQLQMQWAQKFQQPVVIHCRKALPLLFAETAQLKKLPAVIFHGWGGSPQEAEAFLRKGVNAYFSIGKAILRGQKSVCRMATDFDINRLLTETDAPYMRLKAEPLSHPSDISAVTVQCANLRNNGDSCLTQNIKAQQTGSIKQYESCTEALAEINCSPDAVNAFSERILQNFKRAFALV